MLPVRRVYPPLKSGDWWESSLVKAEKIKVNRLQTLGFMTCAQADHHDSCR
jgi:hypothetical protein